MRYSYHSNLSWDNNISTQHTIELDMDLVIGEFLNARDIATTLAMSQGLIRLEIQRIVIEQILPNVFFDVGATSVEGKLNTKTRSHTEGLASMIEHRTPQGIDVEIRDSLSVVFTITTDRPVTALEALCGSNIAVADAITNDIMMHLAIKYFGVTERDISTESSIRNGRLVDHDVRHKGDISGQN